MTSKKNRIYFLYFIQSHLKYLKYSISAQNHHLHICRICSLNQYQYTPCSSNFSLSSPHPISPHKNASYIDTKKVVRSLLHSHAVLTVAPTTNHTKSTKSIKNHMPTEQPKVDLIILCFCFRLVAQMRFSVGHL